MTSPNAKEPTSSSQTIFEALRSNILRGRAFVEAHAQEMDALLQSLAAQYLGATPGLCVMALGSYGRKELCPFSDIDLMFVTQDTATDDERKAIANYLRALQHQGGIKASHSARTLEQCKELAGKDIKIISGLIDARLIAGNEEYATGVAGIVRDLLGDKSTRMRFVREKLQERDARHKYYGDTRYVLEPNIKEGKGGLRDFQTLMWIAEAVYGVKTLEELVERNVLNKSEAARFSKGHDFLLRVRSHLHDLAGQAEERLHFDIQPELAQRLGYASRQTGRSVERFMKHYFLVTRDIGDLTRILCFAIESEEDDSPATPESYFGFEILQERLLFGSAQNIKNHPLDILRLFRVAQETGRSIHPRAIKQIYRHIGAIDEELRQDPLANRLFLEMLTSRKDPGQTLRRLNETGVLGRFVPDFGRIIALMQFDRYHHFTVDEHTLYCIDILRNLEEGKLTEEAPIVSDIVRTITDRTALYVAMFLHDTCKGRGGRHAELGAELAHVLGPRFGLEGRETDLVSWLVHEHLLMSDTAFKRNLNDPKTIADFSAKVRKRERLDLLFTLTTADIMGVGPGRWTAWKARLLEELYTKTCALMDGQEPGITTKVTVPEDYTEGKTRIDITNDDKQSTTVVIVYTPDRPRLFATLCGALSAEGANIMRAHIATQPAKNGRIAIDRFTIQSSSGLPFTQSKRQTDLRQSILGALEDPANLDERIHAYKRPLTKTDLVFDIEPRITITNDASGSDTVVEVECRDRHGLLYDMACTFHDLGLDLRAAKINTQGLRAIDAFYVQTAKRKKLQNSDAQNRLIEALKAKVAKP